ncbi:hypothetical protein OH76DRAFT_1482379 [Lentinus brumalis]|uniref:Uncharacterized protein n=1 Tax=Lentinus brumalis TaxID=2498619 RepID=A0A371DCF2_9APHY|nr:hypothetical protein OH76DRAFT_1482379 [Polyporus brumalis]
MPPKPRIADLQAQLEKLQLDLESTRQAKDTAEAQLQAANTTIADQSNALETATAQAAAAATANQPAAPENGQDQPTIVPRPSGYHGRRIPIRDAMGVEYDDYKAIQRSLHKLCHASGLDWTKDFRLQKTDSLALLYRAARKAHPVLKTYENDWATAELVKQYFQNARSWAREMKYLPPAPPRKGGRSRADKENRRVNRRAARSQRGVSASA